MVWVHFTTTKGEKIAANAMPGARLLEVAQAKGLPLEGTCEGQMACSTCHVVVAAEWFARLTPATDDEEDMLDLAADVTRTSRLACQIRITEALDGLAVTIPGESHDMHRG